MMRETSEKILFRAYWIVHTKCREYRRSGCRDIAGVVP